MFRISTALVAATLMAGAAHADKIQEFTVELTYDLRLLDTEAGAQAILDDLEDQAEIACTVNRFGWTVVDVICVDDLMEKAVAEIANAALTDTYAGTIITF